MTLRVKHERYTLVPPRRGFSSAGRRSFAPLSAALELYPAFALLHNGAHALPCGDATSLGHGQAASALVKRRRPKGR